MLFSRRFAKGSDVRSASLWALVLGVAPVLVGIINSTPAFYDAYFFATEQSLLTYTLTALLGALKPLIWIPVSIFLLFLVAHVILRAWMPEGPGFQWFIDRFHFSCLRTAESRKGVIIGAAVSFLALGIDRLTDSCKAVFAPGLCLSPRL